jgi:hypothetical protein
VRRRRMTMRRRRRIAPLSPPLLLLPLPPTQAVTSALPLLPPIKQWQRWRQHGVALAAGRGSRSSDSRMLRDDTL